VTRGWVTSNTAPPMRYWSPMLALQDLVVRAALTGDKALALQAVIEDPASPRDAGACRMMFDELVARQAPELPF